MVQPTSSEHMPQGRSYKHVPFSGQVNNLYVTSESTYPVSQHYVPGTYPPMQQTLGSPAFHNKFMPHLQNQTLQYPQNQTLQYSQSMLYTQSQCENLYTSVQQAAEATPQFQPLQPMLPQINHQQYNMQNIQPWTVQMQKQIAPQQTHCALQQVMQQNAATQEQHEVQQASAHQIRHQVHVPQSQRLQTHIPNSQQPQQPHSQQLPNMHTLSISTQNSNGLPPLNVQRLNLNQLLPVSEGGSLPSTRRDACCIYSQSLQQGGQVQMPQTPLYSPAHGVSIQNSGGILPCLPLNVQGLNPDQSTYM
jgi:hypothetical protein